MSLKDRLRVPCVTFLSNVPLVNKKYYCSACNRWSYSFFGWGGKSEAYQKMHIISAGYREHVVCPHCLANDRMRWADYVLSNCTDIYSGEHHILHIAPEKCIEKKLKKSNNAEYITGDIDPGKADMVVDITKMPFKDEQFDYIIVNHVMQDVKDEASALSEVSRCLKKGGKFIFSMPLCLDQDTFEMADSKYGEENAKLYGHVAHVRVYGKDMVSRFSKHGFDIKEYVVSDYLSNDEIIRMHMLRDDRIYVGIK